MKVYLSKYRNHWLSPYTILEKVFFWRKIDYDEPIIEKLNGILEPVSRSIQFVLDKVHPKVDYVKLDKWDTWNMDTTLAKIALPMLKQLKATKHGSPLVDLEDVPEHLRATSHSDWDNNRTFHFYDNTDADGNDIDYEMTHRRWEWVLDEMIFAFEHKLDDSWEEEFRKGKIDIKWVPVDKDGNEVPKSEAKLMKMADGPEHTYECDYEGMNKVYQRISNGFRLFGKYYEGLWD